MNIVVIFVTKVEFCSLCRYAAKIEKVVVNGSFKLCKSGNKITAYSSTIDAQAIKATLKLAGVPASEYKISMDYIRKWGMM